MFLSSASSFLGVDRRMVAKGEHSYPVITGGASPATTAAGTAKAEDTLTALSLELEPRNIRAGYQVTTRDLFRLGDQYETALRSDLRGALVESMDGEIINGLASEIAGFLTDTNVSKLKIDGTADGALSAASTGAEIYKGIIALVDGRYAVKPEDLKFVCSPEVYQALYSVSLTRGSTDTTFVAYDVKMALGVEFMASDHVSVITGADKQFYSIFCKSQGKSGAAVHAVWENAMIIHDVYGSNKTSGYESFYIVGHHDFGLVRHQNFAVRRIRA